MSKTLAAKLLLKFARCWICVALVSVWLLLYATRSQHDKALPIEGFTQSTCRKCVAMQFRPAVLSSCAGASTLESAPCRYCVALQILCCSATQLSVTHLGVLTFSCRCPAMLVLQSVWCTGRVDSKYSLQHLRSLLHQ